MIIRTLRALIQGENRKVSKSLIQRIMRIGFNEASDILDALVESGAVLNFGPNDYSLAPEFILLSELKIINSTQETDCK